MALGGDLQDVIHAVAATAERCVSHALLLASQRLLLELLLQSENVGLMEYQSTDLLEGHIGGAVLQQGREAG